MSEVIRVLGVEVEVLRTRRKKSMALRVKEAQASVLVPSWVCTENIAEFISAKHDWIAEQLKKQTEQIESCRKVYESGEEFLYLGRKFPLSIQSGSQRPVSFDGSALYLQIPAGVQTGKKVRSALERWYRSQSEQFFQHQTLELAKHIGARPLEIRVREYKARWGSCSSCGVVSYNWKLIMAPESVCQYVIVHELCHLRHPNHSRAFWAEVERFFPNYRDAVKWLKLNGALLEL